MASEYDAIYSKRGFVHWYVGIGLDSDELLESRENLA